MSCSMLWISFTACTLTTYPQMDDWIFRTFLLTFSILLPYWTRRFTYSSSPASTSLSSPPRDRASTGRCSPSIPRTDCAFLFMAVSLKSGSISSMPSCDMSSKACRRRAFSCSFLKMDQVRLTSDSAFQNASWLVWIIIKDTWFSAA